MSSVILDHRRSVMWLGIAGLVGGAAAGVLHAQSHKAEAQVVASANTPQVSDPMALSAAVAPMLSPDYVTTQVDIINSGRVAERAAQLLKLDSDPNDMADYRKANPGVPAGVYFGRQLHDRLKVIPSVGSRVIAIQFSADDGASAAAGANAFAKAYQDVSLDLVVNPSRQSDEWYQRNLDDLRHQLDDAQGKLIARQRDLGVTAPLTTTAGSASVEAEEARLTTLSQMLAQAQAAQTTAQSHTGSGALPDAMLNPVVQALEADIKRLEGQRSQMASHLGPNALEMREISGQIVSLQRERDKQAATVSRSVAASAGAASANVRGLESQLAAEKTRLIQGRSGRAELGLFQQDVDGLRRAYDDLVTRRASARVAGNGEQTNVSILSLASPQPDRTLLIVTLFTLVGAVAGLVLGLIVAFVQELADRRMRSPEDSVLLLGVPNLGELSFLPARKRRLAHRLRPRLLFNHG